MESNDQTGQQDVQAFKCLPVLDLTQPHKYVKPVKRIIEGQDVPRFLTSHAYFDICTFVMQLNRSMCPRKTDTSSTTQVMTWELGSPIVFPEPIKKMQRMLNSIESIIKEAPPDTGPRRFGNISFRKWYNILESRVPEILSDYLPPYVLHAKSSDEATALDELSVYLLGSFGSAQRLDYGTGHELSFLAFLGCIWKLGVFHINTESLTNDSLERSIVLGTIEPYLRVVRQLIIIYTLEPAGSHGVWGLDDHVFLPYIFGSAQYCPAITEKESMPIEGSLPNTPNPGDVAKKSVVDSERRTNMYFAAIGFINDVKTGPFWEHSPILFDISGVRSGWGKINKGMIKMYNAEVLSKFPVVQHFPFGSLFSWDQDPFAPPPPSSVHASNQPTSHAVSVAGNTAGVMAPRPVTLEGNRAPWASQQSDPNVNRTSTSAIPPSGPPPTRVPWATPGATPAKVRIGGPTRVPWASAKITPPNTQK